MRVTATSNGLIVKDSPGLHWLLGALFIGVGAAFVGGSFGHGPLRWLAGGFGAIGVCAGIWVIARAPRSVLVIDGDVVRLRGETFRREEIESVRLITGEDDEGGRVFQVRLAMRGRADVPVSRLWAHGRAEQLAAAEQIARALRVVVTSPIP